MNRGSFADLYFIHFDSVKVVVKVINTTCYLKCFYEHEKQIVFKESCCRFWLLTVSISAIAVQERFLYLNNLFVLFALLMLFERRKRMYMYSES